MIIEIDGVRTEATRVCHLSTITARSTYGPGNQDVELYRLPDGSLVACQSPANDCRVAPRAVDYPGYPLRRSGL